MRIRVWRGFSLDPIQFQTQEKKQRMRKRGPFFLCARVVLRETVVIVPSEGLGVCRRTSGPQSQLSRPVSHFCFVQGQQHFVPSCGCVGLSTAAPCIAFLFHAYFASRRGYMREIDTKWQVGVFTWKSCTFWSNMGHVCILALEKGREFWGVWAQNCTLLLLASMPLKSISLELFRAKAMLPTSYGSNLQVQKL